MSETAAPELPPYVVPAPTDGPSSPDEVKKLLLAAGADEVWFFEHPKTKDWVLYKPMSASLMAAYRKQSAEQTAKGETGNPDIPEEFLIFRTVLYPTKADLTKLVGRRPMIQRTIAGEVCEVSGYTTEAVQKKL